MAAPLRTALVNPPDILAKGYEEENAIPPLGLGYIAAALRQAGFEADLFDLAACCPIPVELLSAKGFFGYDVYGFTAYTKCFGSAIDTLRLLRRWNPKAVVVFGGPHATPCAEAVLQEYPEVDLVVRGEGEGPMVEILQHLSGLGPPLEEIANLVWRGDGLKSRARGANVPDPSAIHVNAREFSVANLDDLPFPARDYVIEPDRTSLRFRRDGTAVQETHVCSSRGCPKRCTFCSIVVASPNYRVRSVDSLMKEIASLREQGQFGHVFFVDANFAVSVKRTLEFSQRLADWDPGLTWSGTASADLILRHREVMPEIARLNCIELEIGIESGSPTQLTRFNKRTSVEQNKSALLMLAGSSVSVGLDFIMFDPDSTLTEVRENYDFLRDCELFGTSPPACLFNAMRLYPGTAARQSYLTRLGLPDGHLANIRCTHFDPGVATLARLAQQYFDDYQPFLTDSLMLLQARWRDVEEARRPAYRQRLVEAMIDCRHEPYQFFGDILDLAERGELDEGTELSGLWHLEWHDRLTAIVRTAQQLLDCEPDSDRSLDRSDPRWVERHGTVYVIPADGLPVRLGLDASRAWTNMMRARPAEAELA